ncbi:unnamed protein product [Prorocentrum cordatum]|uniref:EF-hand domain-containing protein n=1 Tax=Prorocentrum cordatum TaxID=2364126 RepID=A0ABN9X016_9DINO|nr:unnamed protein product [Polarella glacialis]
MALVTTLLPQTVASLHFLSNNAPALLPKLAANVSLGDIQQTTEALNKIGDFDGAKGYQRVLEQRKAQAASAAQEPMLQQQKVTGELDAAEAEHTRLVRILNEKTGGTAPPPTVISTDDILSGAVTELPVSLGSLAGDLSDEYEVDEATQKEGSGGTGGVAIFARDFLGLHLNPAQGAQGSRVISGIVGIPGGIDFCVASMYLYDGSGFASKNQQLLSDAGMAASSSCLPWLIGGDFNTSPSDLHETSFHGQSGGIIAFPDCSGTCHIAGGMRMNGYFIASPGLSSAAQATVMLEPAIQRSAQDGLSDAISYGFAVHLSVTKHAGDYKHLFRESLDWCLQYDFSLAVSRVAIAAYASAGHVCLQAMISDAVFAQFGVVAGCSLDTFESGVGTLINLNGIEPWNARDLIKKNLDRQLELAKRSPLRSIPILDGLDFVRRQSEEAWGGSLMNAVGLAPATIKKMQFVRILTNLLKHPQLGVRHSQRDIDDLAHVFESIDFDGNGELSLGEWAGGLSVFFKSDPDSAVKAIFQTLDTDHSDDITKRELQEYLKPFVNAMSPLEAASLRPLLLKKATDDIFSEMDADHSDTISVAEMIKWSKRGKDVVHVLADIIDKEVYVIILNQRDKKREKTGRDEKLGTSISRRANSRSRDDPMAGGAPPPCGSGCGGPPGHGGPDGGRQPPPPQGWQQPPPGQGWQQQPPRRRRRAGSTPRRPGRVGRKAGRRSSRRRRAGNSRRPGGAPEAAGTPPSGGSPSAGPSLGAAASRRTALAAPAPRRRRGGPPRRRRRRRRTLAATPSTGRSRGACRPRPRRPRAGAARSRRRDTARGRRRPRGTTGSHRWAAAAAAGASDYKIYTSVASRKWRVLKNGNRVDQAYSWAVGAATVPAASTEAVFLFTTSALMGYARRSTGRRRRPGASSGASTAPQSLVAATATAPTADLCPISLLLPSPSCSPVPAHAPI